MTPFARLSEVAPLNRMGSRNRYVTLGFLTPDAEDPAINRLVAHVSTHPFCHVELELGDGRSFSIFDGGTVFLREKSFANPNYVLLSLAVTDAEHAAVSRFCTDAVARKIGFHNIGMFSAYIRPRCIAGTPSTQLGSTFCSKIVTEALQHGCIKEVSGMNPSCVTPSALYTALRGSERLSIGSVPARHKQLIQFGCI